MANRGDMMKYQDIVVQLKEDILAGRLSGKMPSMRSLTERFQVCHNTILHVFRELSEAGLIVGGTKKNYKIRNVVRRENLILCVMRPPAEINFLDNFSTEMCTGVIRAAELNHCNVLFPHQNAGVLYHDSSDAFLQQMEAEMRPLLPFIRGIIAAASIRDDQLEKYILPFAEHRPVVLLNRDSQLNSVGKVVFPTEEACGKLRDLMLRQPARKFILCQTYYTTDHRDDHIQLMQKQLLAHGVADSAIVMISGLLETPDSSAQLKVIGSEICKNRKKAVVFVSSSYGACWVADHLIEQGLIAGQDYRLCSFDGKISSAMHQPQITSVQISGLELGEKAVELLLSETPLRRIYTTAQLQLRETL